MELSTTAKDAEILYELASQQADKY